MRSTCGKSRPARSLLLAVVIQEGFDEGFVSVRVRLFAHEGFVEPQIHLFEDGMADIVHRVQEARVVGVRGGILIGHQASGGGGIEMQFNFQKTTIEIAKIVQGLHGERDGSEGLHLTYTPPEQCRPRGS